MASTLRFLLQHARGRGELDVVETAYARGELRPPATLYRPRDDRRLPAWILLHGITYTGREHPELVRLARSLASAGFVVLVPDVPEWRGLDVAPDVTAPTIAGCLDALASRDDVDVSRTGVLGFSFGATLALHASIEPVLRGRLAGIASWGGYADLERQVRFLFTGRHTLDGVEYHIDPDPYGRWILGACYLREDPEHRADAGPVAEALLALAEEAGRRRVFAGDAMYEPMQRELRARLPAGARALFDLFVWSRERPRPPERELLALAEPLTRTIARVDPILDDLEPLRSVDVPVLLAHGRDDALVPFTECERLRRLLPERVVRSATVTGMYAHSGSGEIGNPLGRIVEPLRYLRLLRRLLSLI